MDFLERLDDIMKKRGLNKHTLSQRSGIPYSTINSFYTKGYENTKLKTLGCLAQSLDVSLGYLAWGESEEITYLDNVLPIETRKIPLLGTIAAGVPIYADEQFEYYVECGTDIMADFALKVRGNSMINARINDGDIVFIRKQETVRQGEIAAVLIEDEATLKRFRQYGSHIVLQAENPEVPDIEFELSEDMNVRILGKAVAFQSDVK